MWWHVVEAGLHLQWSCQQFHIVVVLELQKLGELYFLVFWQSLVFCSLSGHTELMVKRRSALFMKPQCVTLLLLLLGQMLRPLRHCKSCWGVALAICFRCGDTVDSRTIHCELWIIVISRLHIKVPSARCLSLSSCCCGYRSTRHGAPDTNWT